MKILFLGDIFGKPGRKAVIKALGSLKERYEPDFLLANVENLAGGHGVNTKTLREMKELGFHGFTSGNHIWDNREVLSFIGMEKSLFRPANYPDSDRHGCPGRGYGVVHSGNQGLFVVNLMGRAFMDAIDCPFACVDKVLNQNREGLPVIVDMHAETTSEKSAMGWYLDGRVAALVGTHTHVQTADERILPNGTAYISDIGMCGSNNSIIGLKVNGVVEKFLTKRKTSYQVATENLGVCAVSIHIDSDNKAQSIERIWEHVRN